MKLPNYNLKKRMIQQSKIKRIEHHTKNITKYIQLKKFTTQTFELERTYEMIDCGNLYK